MVNNHLLTKALSKKLWIKSFEQKALNKKLWKNNFEKTALKKIWKIGLKTKLRKKEHSAKNADQWPFLLPCGSRAGWELASDRKN